MAKYPPTIQRLIDAFSDLPSIGPKTAERFVLYLLNRPAASQTLTAALLDSQQNIRRCQNCQTFSEKSPCYICSNPQRDPKLLCVVATTADLATIESTGQYHGRFFVLGGTLEPLSDQTSSALDTSKLLTTLKNNSTSEVILAFDSTIEGEATVLALYQQLKDQNLKISRLAKGLPMGSQLIYADEVTISNALGGRKEL